MGMFDTVWIECPECKHDFMQQTKAGPCELNNYYLPGREDNDIPASIIEDLRDRDGSFDCRGYNMKCDRCGCVAKIRVYGKLVGLPIKRITGVWKKGE